MSGIGKRLNFGSPMRKPLVELQAQATGFPALFDSPVVTEGGGAASTPPRPSRRLFASSPVAASVSPPPRNRGERVDDDPAIEIDNHKVGVFGTKYVAVKNHTSINDSDVRVQMLIQAHTTYTADDFNGLTEKVVPLGVFTFLVVVDESDAGLTHRLVAKEVRSELELGTRHNAIAHDASLGIRRVLCGGEIEKTAGGLRFNLQSGHYTVIRFRKSRLSGEIDAGNAATKSGNYVAAVKALLPAAAYVQFTPTVTFIKEEALPRPLDEAELHLYTSCGLSVFLFDDRANAMMFQQKAESGTGGGEEETALELLETYRGEPFEADVTKATVSPRSNSRRQSRRQRQRRSRRLTRRRR